MAVVKNYMKEEQQRINNQKNSTPVYGANFSPVSQQAKAATPKVTQPAVQYTAGVKPQNYVSRYQQTMDSILAQIQNPDAFRYEFNGDELFKSYADQYTQRGKQAMLDTMGQAVGLTGGYGNSYAQQVGQQTYQNYLQSLYDRGFDLRNAAYGQYTDELGNLKDSYSALQAAEAADYGRYSDALEDWRNQEARQEAIRQFNVEQALKQAQFEEDKRRYDQEWAHMLALEAAAAAAEEAGGGGGGGKRSSLYYRSGNTYYKVDENGRYQPVDPSTIPDSARVDETTIDSKVQSKISQSNNANPQRAAAKTATNLTADKRKKAQLSY